MDNICKILILILSLVLIILFMVYLKKNKVITIERPAKKQTKEYYTDDDDDDIYQSIKRYRKSKDNVYKKYLEFNDKYSTILKEIRKNKKKTKSMISPDSTSTSSTSQTLPYTKKNIKPINGKCPPCFYPK